MKTVVMYVLGIPCILVGSRFTGLDRVLVRESAQPHSTVFNDLVSDVPADQIASAIVTFPESEAMAASVTAADEQLMAIVVPEKSASVEATARGIVRTILVRPNDVVEAGQRLAVLDTRTIEADIRKQHQQTVLFESKTREARGEHARLQEKLEKRAPLVARRIITVEEYDDLQMELNATAERINQYEAQVRTSQEEENKLERTLDDYVVTAPFSGKVTRVIEHAGQFLEHGDVILEMESTGKQVRALVPTLLSAKIHGLTFHVVDAHGRRVDMAIAEIEETGTATGYQDVLFDLQRAEPFISNQSLAVFVDEVSEPAMPEMDLSSGLAAN